MKADEGLTKGWRRADAQSASFETLYGGQFTLSPKLMILNYPDILSHQRNTTVSSETTPHTKWLLHYIFITWPDPDKHQMVKFPNHLLPLYIPDTMKDLVAPEAKNNLSIHPEHT